MAGQGCGELEPGPAAACLGLTGLGLVRVREHMSPRACDAEGDVSAEGLWMEKVTGYSDGSAKESVHS